MPIERINVKMKNFERCTKVEKCLYNNSKCERMKRTFMMFIFLWMAKTKKWEKIWRKCASEWMKARVQWTSYTSCMLYVCHYNTCELWMRLNAELLQFRDENLIQCGWLASLVTPNRKICIKEWSQIKTVALDKPCHDNCKLPLIAIFLSMSPLRQMHFMTLCVRLTWLLGSWVFFFCLSKIKDTLLQTHTHTPKEKCPTCVRFYWKSFNYFSTNDKAFIEIHSEKNKG